MLISIRIYINFVFSLSLFFSLLSTKEEEKINVDSIEMKNDEKERSYIQMTLIQS